MRSLAAVPNDYNDLPQPPRLRLVPAPRKTQRELVILSLIRCPDAPRKSDRS
jgi:hypothetical protein